MGAEVAQLPPTINLESTSFGKEPREQTAEGELRSVLLCAWYHRW